MKPKRLNVSVKRKKKHSANTHNLLCRETVNSKSKYCKTKD